MFNVFKRNDVLRFSFSHQRLAINLKHLKCDECLLIKYDQQGNPVVIQKFETRSPQGRSMLGRAETDILPGQKGRVLYEGASWKASCAGARAICKGRQVLVIAERSLHLFVVPVEAPLGDLL